MIDFCMNLPKHRFLSDPALDFRNKVNCTPNGWCRVAKTKKQVFFFILRNHIICNSAIILCIVQVQYLSLIQVNQLSFKTVNFQYVKYCSVSYIGILAWILSTLISLSFFQSSLQSIISKAKSSEKGTKEICWRWQRRGPWNPGGDFIPAFMDQNTNHDQTQSQRWKTWKARSYVWWGIWQNCICWSLSCS